MTSKAFGLAQLGNAYGDLYLVSREGKVFSLITNKWLKPRSAGSGYLSVMLYKNKKGKNFLIHRLVAEAFIGRVPDKNCINHIDGNKTNNHLENLEWVTHSENLYHANRIGLRTSSEKQKAAARKNGKVMRKLSDSQVEVVRKMYADGMLQREIGGHFGMSQTQISAILLGKVYREAA